MDKDWVMGGSGFGWEMRIVVDESGFEFNWKAVEDQWDLLGIKVVNYWLWSCVDKHKDFDEILSWMQSKLLFNREVKKIEIYIHRSIHHLLTLFGLGLDKYYQWDFDKFSWFRAGSSFELLLWHEIQNLKNSFFLGKIIAVSIFSIGLILVEVIEPGSGVTKVAQCL